MERTITLKSNSQLTDHILILIAVLFRSAAALSRKTAAWIVCYMESFYERCENDSLSKKEILIILAIGAVVGSILHSLGFII
ncbi:MAG: hypothetical protein HUJ55_08160 [Ileibacterium sp.]|nr:hypothetical protein [Ileibacterium sp.]